VPSLNQKEPAFNNAGFLYGRSNYDCGIARKRTRNTRLFIRALSRMRHTRQFLLLNERALHLNRNKSPANYSLGAARQRRITAPDLPVTGNVHPGDLIKRSPHLTMRALS